MTRETAQTRAREIAHGAGRGPADVVQSDYEQAKRELTGTSDQIRQEKLLSSAPLSSAVRQKPPRSAAPGSSPPRDA